MDHVAARRGSRGIYPLAPFPLGLRPGCWGRASAHVWLLAPILSLDLPFNHLILPFPSSIFFPLGQGHFFFPFYISAKTCIFSLVTRKKANDCLSFSQSGSLRFCKRKERRRIVISNHQKTQQRYHFGRKKVAIS